MSDKHDSQKPIVNPPSKSLILAGALFSIFLVVLVTLFIFSIYTPTPNNDEPKSSTIDIGWASVLYENNLSRYGIPMKEYRVRIRKTTFTQNYLDRFEQSAYIPLDAREGDFMVIVNNHNNKFLQKEAFIVMHQPTSVKRFVQSQTFFVKLKNYQKTPPNR